MTAPCPTFGFVVTIEADTERARALAGGCLNFLKQHDLTGRVLGREIVVRRDGSPATHADRELVRVWVNEHAGDVGVSIGDIVDLGGG